MTINEFAALLETSGMPVTYRAWPVGEAPPLPWICYRFTNTNNFPADNRVYLRVDDFDVELYTKTKDPEAEAAVESALSAFFWQKTETYIETEDCYMILYELEV